MDDASLALILKKGAILLTERADVPIWVLPGGGIEPGETPEEACIREVFEETGLSVKIVSKAREFIPVNKLSSNTHLFICEPLTEEIRLSDETKNAKFFKQDNLPKNTFWPHKNWILESVNSPFQKRELKEINYLNFFLFFLKKPLITLRFLLSKKL